MDLSGSAMSIPDENFKLFVPLRRNLGNIEFGLALGGLLPQALALSASEGSVWARRKETFERVGRKRLSVSEGQGLDKCLITTRAWWVVSTSWEGPWRLTPPSYSHPRGRDRSHPRDREQSQPMGRERSNYTSSEGGLEVNTSFKFS